MALLLVFRTNSSYGRYDEGRKVFGSNVNRCRDLARQSLCFIQDSVDRERRSALLRYIAAFPFCVKAHIDTDKDLREELRGVVCAIISRTRLGRCGAARTVCDAIADHARVVMDLNITQLHDNVGACERILRTPIPPSYSHLTSRMLIIWHLMLPLALWDSCNWLTIPATGFSATALFCIDEVGVIIEEPFSILPLKSICELVQKNVAELTQAHEDSEYVIEKDLR